MKDTENTGQELLPCPFCGSAPEVLENAAAGISAYVRCGCQSHIFETRDLAIKNWNRRAPAVPVPQPDALRNAAQSALDLLEYVKKAPSDAGFIDWRAAEVEKELRAALSGDATAPQPPEAAKEKLADAVLQMLLEQKAKKDALIANGICPTCEGKGECGGQFTGGEWTCEECNGTGRAHGIE